MDVDSGGCRGAAITLRARNRCEVASRIEDEKYNDAQHPLHDVCKCSSTWNIGHVEDITRMQIWMRVESRVLR